ncbi:MAG: hypothetical protein NTZ15_12060 [Burkholderiales bacterium]|nr:hypothetical protein [Burkholderiales bacterium]
MQLRTVLLGAALALLLSGCSAEAWYNGMQQSAQEACRIQRSGPMESCAAGRYAKPYAEFEKERSVLKP